MKRLLDSAAKVCLLLAGAVWIQLLAADDPTYPLLWVLPATFIVATGAVVFASSGSDSFRWLEYSLAALWFVRLVVIPSMMVAAGAEYVAIRPLLSADEYRLGTVYMAYETVVTATVLIIVRALVRPAKGAIDSISFRPGSYVPQTVLILVGGAALVFPAVRERFSFFTSTISGTAREIASGYDAGFSAIANLTNLARLAVPGLFITLALKAQGRRPSLAYPVLAMVGCVAVNLFYVATSRASFFVPLVAAIIVLALAFPVGRSLVVVSAGSALILATVVVTQNKSFASSPQSTIGDVANYLSTYLMGPKEYAVGIRAVGLYDSAVTGSTFASDLLGNIPVLSELIDPLNRTSQYFNWTYFGANVGLGGGYIAPASIQGAFYIGWVLGPLVAAAGLIPSVLAVRYLRRPHQDPSLSYVAAFTVVMSLIYHTNSFSTSVAFLAFPILPLLLLASVDRWLAKSMRGDPRQRERHTYRPA